MKTSAYLITLLCAIQRKDLSGIPDHIVANPQTLKSPVLDIEADINWQYGQLRQDFQSCYTVILNVN
jgi:hypothetical protein